MIHSPMTTTTPPMVLDCCRCRSACQCASRYHRGEPQRVLPVQAADHGCARDRTDRRRAGRARGAPVGPRTPRQRRMRPPVKYSVSLCSTAVGVEHDEIKRGALTAGTHQGPRIAITSTGCLPRPCPRHPLPARRGGAPPPLNVFVTASRVRPPVGLRDDRHGASLCGSAATTPRSVFDSDVDGRVPITARAPWLCHLNCLRPWTRRTASRCRALPTPKCCPRTPGVAGRHPDLCSGSFWTWRGTDVRGGRASDAAVVMAASARWRSPASVCRRVPLSPP